MFCIFAVSNLALWLCHQDSTQVSDGPAELKRDAVKQVVLQSTFNTHTYFVSMFNYSAALSVIKHTFTRLIRTSYYQMESEVSEVPFF